MTGYMKRESLINSRITKKRFVMKRNEMTLEIQKVLKIQTSSDNKIEEIQKVTDSPCNLLSRRKCNVKPVLRLRN